MIFFSFHSCKKNEQTRQATKTHRHRYEYGGYQGERGLGREVNGKEGQIYSYGRRLGGKHMIQYTGDVS